MDDWEVLSSDVVYRGRFNVVRDTLRHPDGGINDYTWTPTGDAVAILAFDLDGNVVLTRQYRHPLRRMIFDLPAGGVEAGEAYVDAARRELREETGFRAGRLERLCAYIPSAGRSPMVVQVFVASELTPGPPQPDETEFIQVVHMAWTDVLKMVLSGLPTDGALTCAVLTWHARQTREAAQW